MNEANAFTEEDIKRLRKSEDRRLASRRILLPRDTNHRGEIFGGALLAEMDLAGAMEARHHTSHDVATVAFKDVAFDHPVKVGDVVSFWTELVKVGRTSITVFISVESSRNGTDDAVHCAHAMAVYVAVKVNGLGQLVATPLLP